MVFNHVDDYKSFLTENLTPNDLVLVRDLLDKNLDRFISSKKQRSKTLKCLNQTVLQLKTQMVKSYEFHFLKHVENKD